MKKTYTYRGITFQRHKDESGLTWSPSIKQIERLIDLADVLRLRPPPEFTMATYARITDLNALPPELSKDRYFEVGKHSGAANTPHTIRAIGAQGKKIAHDCGAVCCAVGTGAFHGIGADIAKKSWGWDDFADKVFGCGEGAFGWYYLFAADWASTDNTAKGAAARILHLLIEGPAAIHALRHDLVDCHRFRAYSALDRANALKVYRKYLKHPIEPKEKTSPPVVGSGWSDYVIEKPR